MSWSQAQKEAFARSDGKTTELVAIELRHSLFVSPVRLVQSDHDLRVTLEDDSPVNSGQIVIFTAAAFRARLPASQSKNNSTLNIEIDGVGGAIHPYIKTAVSSGEPIECRLRTYSVDVTDVTDGELSSSLLLVSLDLEMIGANIKMQTVSVEFGFANPANQAFPSQRYTLEEYPTLES